ncbi:MAG TPA: radical SAM protein [Verrucomicrobiales bacterium]|nr:radical SAM protein [Verrucomicrobiales bacterium]
MNRFEKQLQTHKASLKREALLTLQLNIGRQCNQACRHCHVDAAPWRTETLAPDIANRINDWIRTHRPQTVDITGGAPELCPEFRGLVQTASKAGCDVIDRCNLTILLEDNFEWLPEFFSQHDVTIIASLPCYQPKNVNHQRGGGVFDKSIRALQLLNQHGYGKSHALHLVYNPVGPSLPPDQSQLEADYKEALHCDFGIHFDRLFTITNQPIARFAEDLHRQDKWDEYLELLSNSFNPESLESLMCRSTLSVSHEGDLFDCDFNQMLELNIRNGKPLKLWDITPSDLEGRPILTGEHCLACTAGSGSSCTGALA